MTRGCFITGTDTEVGKTLVTAGLLHACRRHQRSALGMKPVAAGAAPHGERLLNDDVETIIAASSVMAERNLVNPYLFAEPIAPHIAADHDQVVIDPGHILDCYQKLAALADVVIVEGVGGFRVPLHQGFDTAELACRLGLPVILVVGVRLGCINHALLTAEAIASRKLRCIGWVANHIDATMTCAEENIAALDRLLQMPRIGRIEHLLQPDVQTAAARLQLPAELLD